MTASERRTPRVSRILVWLCIHRSRSHFFRVAHRLLGAALGSDIYAKDIGVGLRLPHPYGIVVHSSTSIGTAVTIRQHVTIGSPDSEGARIEDGVEIGAGAVLLGDVRIGRGARIGANAVVLRDVPAGSTAVGVPATIVHTPSVHLP
jgi:serine O-acetyltransferase